MFAATDFHGSVEAAKNLHSAIEDEKPDLALACGDISDFGDAVDLQVVLQGFFGGDVPGCYVTGNCDPRELLEKGVPGYEDRNLHGKTKLVGNCLIIGLGGSTPTPVPTWTQLHEDEFLMMTQHLVGQVVKHQYDSLVFLLHNPPFNTNTDLSSTGKHVGSRVLRDLAVQLKPQVIFHGHIHEARGIDKIEESYVINPGACLSRLLCHRYSRKGEGNS